VSSTLKTESLYSDEYSFTLGVVDTIHCNDIEKRKNRKKSRRRRRKRRKTRKNKENKFLSFLYFPPV